MSNDEGDEIMREDYDVSDGPEGDDEILDTSFRQELTGLINRYSKEQASGTPDFILAEYLMQQLEVWNKSVAARAVWRGEMRSLHAIEPEVEYRASIGGVVFGGARTTPEAAIDAAWSAYADYAFSVDDENFHVTSRTVGQWTPVENGETDG